jgi:hypothetical protein
MIMFWLILAITIMSIICIGSLILLVREIRYKINSGKNGGWSE